MVPRRKPSDTKTKSNMDSTKTENDDPGSSSKSLLKELDISQSDLPRPSRSRHSHPGSPSFRVSGATHSRSSHSGASVSQYRYRHTPSKLKHGSAAHSRGLLSKYSSSHSRHVSSRYRSSRSRSRSPEVPRSRSGSKAYLPHSRSHSRSSPTGSRSGVSSSRSLSLLRIGSSHSKGHGRSESDISRSERSLSNSRRSQSKSERSSSNSRRSQSKSERSSSNSRRSQSKPERSSSNSRRSQSKSERSSSNSRRSSPSPKYTSSDSHNSRQKSFTGTTSSHGLSPRRETISSHSAQSTAKSSKLEMEPDTSDSSRLRAKFETMESRQPATSDSCDHHVHSGSHSVRSRSKSDSKLDHSNYSSKNIWNPPSHYHHRSENRTKSSLTLESMSKSPSKKYSMPRQLTPVVVEEVGNESFNLDEIELPSEPLELKPKLPVEPEFPFVVPLPPPPLPSCSYAPSITYYPVTEVPVYSPYSFPPLPTVPPPGFIAKPPSPPQKTLYYKSSPYDEAAASKAYKRSEQESADQLTQKSEEDIETAASNIVNEIKASGLFDKIRKKCIATVEETQVYKDLAKRVEETSDEFLKNSVWSPAQGQNLMRELMREKILFESYFDEGLDALVNEALGPDMVEEINPDVDDVVYNYIGAKNPNAIAPPGDSPTRIEESNCEIEEESPAFEKFDEVSPPRVSPQELQRFGALPKWESTTQSNVTAPCTRTIKKENKTVVQKKKPSATATSSSKNKKKVP